MPINPNALAYRLEELRDFMPRMPDGEAPDKRAVRRWLQRHRVPIDRVGKCDIVWVADLAEAFPQIVRGLELRRGREAPASC